MNPGHQGTGYWRLRNEFWRYGMNLGHQGTGDKGMSSGNKELIMGVRVLEI